MSHLGTKEVGNKPARGETKGHFEMLSFDADALIVGCCLTSSHREHGNSHAAEACGKQLLPAKLIHEGGCDDCAQYIYGTDHRRGKLATFHSCLREKQDLSFSRFDVSG